MIRPDLLDWNWPDCTLARWEMTGGKDYLPPFSFLVLLSEFQRLAQNVTAHIALSFRSNGTPLTIASAVDELGKVDVEQIGSAFSIFENCLAKQTTLIPLQTHALLPEDSVLISQNPLAGIRHTEKAFCLLNDTIANGPSDALSKLAGFSEESRAAFVAQAMSAHPDHRRDRPVRGGHLVVRTEVLAKYWGLDWLQHACVGLFQIASAADRLNAQYRDTRRPQRVAHNQSRVTNRNQAVARIARAWVETTHPAAYAEICRKHSAALKRNSKERSFPSDFGLEKEFIDDDADDGEEICSIVDIEGIFAQREVSKMKELAVSKPVEGLPGFTAQYHPDLWLEKSESDDIGFWIGRRQVAMIGRIANLPSQSPMIVREILSDIELLRFAPSTAEDRAAQNLAMTVCEFALDPMHAFFRRKGIKLAGSFKSTTRLPRTYLHN